MTTINTILEELKDVPVDRLEDVHSFIHTLKKNSREVDENREKILTFAGIFTDMNGNDFDDFVNETKRARQDLFNRDSNV